MRSLFFSSIFFLLFLTFTPTAFASETSAAISFFRSRDSLFPSGQASRNSLEEKLIRSEIEIAYLSSWDKREWLVKSYQILRDIQVARYVETHKEVELLSVNRSDAFKIKTFPAKTQLEILSVEDFWLKVKERTTGVQGWLTLPQVHTRHDDTGYFVNILPTPLRKEPQGSATILVTVPRLSRFVPLEISKNFLKIQFNGQLGWVDITDFVSHADFAVLAYHPKKNWLPVLYRNNDMIITKKGEFLPLKEILGYVTNIHKAIIVSGETKSPPIRARVELSKVDANIWGLSLVDGHGAVWWKKKNLIFEEDKAAANTLSTDVLLKREIYSIAFESKSSMRGLVSSEGVYHTHDGLHWTLLPQFGKKNYPVSIHPNGTWFVGPYKSINKGKSFEPFIRWDHIAQAIESAYHRSPKILRLTQIEALANSTVQIHIDTGHNKVKLRSSLYDVRWNVLKN